MRAWPLGLLTAILSIGCARVRATTEIKPDGSWNRTLVFTGADSKDGQMTPTIGDSFALPSGAAWKSHEEKNTNGRAVTFERTFALPSTSQADVGLKGAAPGKLDLVNNVTVTRSGPGRFEYRETLHWQGEVEKDLVANLTPEELAKIKAALPKALATDENVRVLTQKTTALMIPALFGPGDPLLAIGLLHPDLAERRVGQRMGGVLIQALEEQFGDKMQPAERREVARKIIQETVSSAKISQPDPSPATKSSGGAGLVPLMFIVKTTGKIISSNGEIDELTGEVFWAMFGEAAAVKDLALTAVVEFPEK